MKILILLIVVPEFLENNMYSRFVEEHITELAAPENSAHREPFFTDSAEGPVDDNSNEGNASSLASVKPDASDPP